MSKIMLCNCKQQNTRHIGSSSLAAVKIYTCVCVVGLLNLSFFFLKSVGFYFMLM